MSGLMERPFARLFVSASVLVFGLTGAAAEPTRNVSTYNLEQGIGLKGFDPVAVFPEGGGQARPGSTQFSVNHMGVVYRFASLENQQLFAANPAKYEPTYGGWCAYAMGRVAGEPSLVDIQPQRFTLHGNRAHYFVSNRAKREFDQDVMGFELRADANWKQVSGEDPRN